jgi:hypothetical protein
MSVAGRLQAENNENKENKKIYTPAAGHAEMELPSPGTLKPKRRSRAAAAGTRKPRSPSTAAAGTRKPKRPPPTAAGRLEGAKTRLDAFDRQNAEDGGDAPALICDIFRLDDATLLQVLRNAGFTTFARQPAGMRAGRTRAAVAATCTRFYHLQRTLVRKINFTMPLKAPPLAMYNRLLEQNAQIDEWQRTGIAWTVFQDIKYASLHIDVALSTGALKRCYTRRWLALHYLRRVTTPERRAEMMLRFSRSTKSHEDPEHVRRWVGSPVDAFRASSSADGGAPGTQLDRVALGVLFSFGTIDFHTSYDMTNFLTWAAQNRVEWPARPPLLVCTSQQLCVCCVTPMVAEYARKWQLEYGYTAKQELSVLCMAHHMPGGICVTCANHGTPFVMRLLDKFP